ncbi:methyl-CpG binding domain-containing protein [Phthorimaea operculella]|nr:methyl-CpG binding domain-containing protein [Phthorimaea operculella]
MSDDMAVGDNATGEEAKLNGDDAAPPAADAEGASSEPLTEPAPQEGEESAPSAEGDVNFHVTIVKEEEEKKEEESILDEPPPEATDDPEERPNTKPPPEPLEDVPMEDQVDGTERGIKRRASEAFSDGGDEFKGFGDAALPEEEFKGFEVVEEKDLSMDYSKVLERLEAEVEAGKQSYTPLKTVVAMAIPRASKRLRQDTDGSRPSSALSSRSDGEGALSNDPVQILNMGTSATSSPANRRRATTEMSSPLLRIPLERGWKRELVYRAALDAHSRRNADIYYYTPQGKKLRSTRERGWKRELVYRAALDAHSRRNADIYYYTPQGKKLRSTREVSVAYRAPLLPSSNCRSKRLYTGPRSTPTPGGTRIYGLQGRAALDAHSRRNADIYYYTPQGKKLRSTREGSTPTPGETRIYTTTRRKGRNSGLQGRARRPLQEERGYLLLHAAREKTQVYKGGLDAHSRRNADIYYYTPQGKKLRSTRELLNHRDVLPPPPHPPRAGVEARARVQGRARRPLQEERGYILLHAAREKTQVYKGGLDAHSRRNADIYYYTPQGKKLRSTREGSTPTPGGTRIFTTTRRKGKNSGLQGRRPLQEERGYILLHAAREETQVYKGGLDAHSRRNADIYYYTPQGKKLRSTREVSALTVDELVTL